MKNEIMQRIAILYPVGNDKVFAYHVCYSVTHGSTLRPNPWTRVTTVSAVRGQLSAKRIIRTSDPELWAKIRAALVTGERVIYPNIAA